jgi:hypothetical protein
MPTLPYKYLVAGPAGALFCLNQSTCSFEGVAFHDSAFNCQSSAINYYGKGGCFFYSSTASRLLIILGVPMLQLDIQPLAHLKLEASKLFLSVLEHFGKYIPSTSYLDTDLFIYASLDNDMQLFRGEMFHPAVFAIAVCTAIVAIYAISRSDKAGKQGNRNFCRARC